MPIAASTHDTPPQPVAFRDIRLPIEERVADLLVRLTTSERIAMLHQYAPPVPRLGLGPFRTGTEALHGAAWLGRATVFPQAVGLGATWNPELLEAVGRITSTEVRALHAKDPTVSLMVWAPVVNLLRDPRWGRNEEGYSEDVLLTASLATAYCRGLRGEHPRVVRTAPTLKHFLAYNNETERSETSSTLRPRVLHEYDAPVFREPIRAGVVDGVMPSYNLVNGRPNHVSPLLNGLLRGWSDRELLVVSDAQAPSNLVDDEHYFDDHVVGHAAALRAGVDSFTDHGDDPTCCVSSLTEALRCGLVSSEDVDRAVRRVLTVRFATGEFDGDADPYATIDETALDLPEHRVLARRAAREQVVLLRNDERLLPLRPRAGMRVTVVGPFADSLRTDWYSGTMPYQVTIARGLRNALSEVGGEVTSAEGADRIALRALGAGGLVRVRTVNGVPVLAVGDRARVQGRDGATVDELADPSARFDLFDWGEGVSTLRNVATGRFVTLRGPDRAAAGRLVADQEQPNGWEVRETFSLVAVGDAVVLRNICTGGYVGVDAATGTLHASVRDAASAERFDVRVLRSGVQEARQAVRDADAVVVVVGNDTHINGRETQDRATLALPPTQERLVRAVSVERPDAVLVVMSSYPYAIDWADRHLRAILWTSHAGQETGNALADVLLGTHAPTGRLPQTWYRSDADLSDLLDYDIIKARRTYLYFEREPLYPFGHGLSYTSFAYRGPRVARHDDVIAATVDVANVGDRAGVEVVQLYSRQAGQRLDRPSRRLQAFARVELAAGESQAVTLEFPISGLAHWDVAAGDYRVEPGAYDLLIGGSSASFASTARLDVAGEPVGARPAVGVALRAADFDDYEGVTLVDVSREAGDAVTPATERPGWILFRRANLGVGAVRLAARVSRTAPGTARLTLRRDDPHAGEPLGWLLVPSTGGRYAWTRRSTEITAPPGVYDLYLVLDGEQRLDWFELDADDD